MEPWVGILIFFVMFVLVCFLGTGLAVWMWDRWEERDMHEQEERIGTYKRETKHWTHALDKVKRYTRMTGKMSAGLFNNRRGQIFFVPATQMLKKAFDKLSARITTSSKGSEQWSTSADSPCHSEGSSPSNLKRNAKSTGPWAKGSRTTTASASSGKVQFMTAQPSVGSNRDTGVESIGEWATDSHPSTAAVSTAMEKESIIRLTTLAATANTTEQRESKSVTFFQEPSQPETDETDVFDQPCQPDTTIVNLPPAVSQACGLKQLPAEFAFLCPELVVPSGGPDRVMLLPCCPCSSMASTSPDGMTRERTVESQASSWTVSTDDVERTEFLSVVDLGGTTMFHITVEFGLGKRVFLTTEPGGGEILGFFDEIFTGAPSVYLYDRLGQLCGELYAEVADREMGKCYYVVLNDGVRYTFQGDQRTSHVSATVEDGWPVCTASTQIVLGIDVVAARVVRLTPNSDAGLCALALLGIDTLEQNSTGLRLFTPRNKGRVRAAL